MNAVPVIGREMLTQARVGFTYNLRIIGAAVCIAVCLFFAAQRGLQPNMGAELFSFLNVVLMIAIWVMVPFLTADCISRERREGTIGLLFLTPLRAGEVVLAKGAANGIRALTLLLAVLPVFTISFLMGGVSWKQAVAAASFHFGSVCWALAAGLLASSASKSWARAITFSGCLAYLFACFFLALVTICVEIFKIAAVRATTPTLIRMPGISAPVLAWSSPPPYVTGMGYYPPWVGVVLGLFNGGRGGNLMLPMLVVAGVSLVALLLAISLAAWNLRRYWQEEPPSARRTQVQAMLCKPVVAVGFFRRWLRHKLERNPIGWLEQRTWSGRAVTWGWFAVMVSFYSMIFYTPNIERILASVQNTMAWGLLVVMSLSASGSFQRERETRVLELLLVSPMSTGQLVNGRLRGIWGQFVPSLALILCVWFYLSDTFRSAHMNDIMVFYCVSFVALPIIGLYYSLKRANFITAILSTMFMGLLMPYIFRLVIAIAVFAILPLTIETPHASFFERLILATLGDPGQVLHSATSLIVIQVFIAYCLYQGLHRNLLNRTFVFQKAG